MIFKNNTQRVLSFQVFACTRVGERWKRGHGDTEEQGDGEVRTHRQEEKPEVGLGRTKLGRKDLLRFFPFPRSRSVSNRRSLDACGKASMSKGLAPTSIFVSLSLCALLPLYKYQKDLFGRGNSISILDEDASRLI
ncbi:hypothetical protein NSTC745_06477 [Nostoc sp. DSM 114161]|jgi:hypothetical protein